MGALEKAAPSWETISICIISEMVFSYQLADFWTLGLFSVSKLHLDDGQCISRIVLLLPQLMCIWGVHALLPLLWNYTEKTTTKDHPLVNSFVEIEKKQSKALNISCKLNNVACNKLKLEDYWEAEKLQDLLFHATPVAGSSTWVASSGGAMSSAKRGGQQQLPQRRHELSKAGWPVAARGEAWGRDGVGADVGGEHGDAGGRAKRLQQVRGGLVCEELRQARSKHVRRAAAASARRVGPSSSCGHGDASKEGGEGPRRSTLQVYKAFAVSFEY
ncbi:hypothetical protein EJB05_12332, partial [Eragrostis curvula]